MAGRITVTAEVVGIGSDGTEPSVVFAVHRHGVYSADKTLLKRYLFNCGEGTQRLCGENGIKLNSLDSIFLTRLDVRSASGIPGLVFALGGLGASHLRVNGPVGTRDRLTAMESFVRRKYPKIECVEVEAAASADAEDQNSGITRSCWTPGDPIEDAYARIIAVPMSPGSATAPACWICEKCTPLEEKPTAEFIQQSEPSEYDQDPDRRWLRRFYETKGLRDKIPHMDAILRRYRGRMDDLKAQLASKYGNADDSESSSSSSSESQDEEKPKERCFDKDASLDREWLEAFYQRYEPAKVGRVDQILRQFAGREDQLKAMLLAKYGDTSALAEKPPPVKKQKIHHSVENHEEADKTDSSIPERFVDNDELPQASKSTSPQQLSGPLCYILQFRSPPFPVVWIVDVQTTDQIASLAGQLLAGECGHRPVLVVHLSPPDVVHHSKYEAWIKSLGRLSDSVIEHLVFDGRALKAVARGIFSFAFVTSARNYLRNETADASLQKTSRWGSLRDLLASRPLGAEQSLQMRIRRRMDGAALTAEIAQAKLKYTLHDTSVADYSHTGWKHIAERSVDEEDQATPPPSPSIRQPNQVATRRRLSILGTGSAAPSKLRASTSMYLSLSRDPVNGSLPGMLVDCGEGAFGQLERQFDSDSRALASCIAGLKCIWISHHHADHQCGLLRVLDEYLRVTSNGPAVLFVVAPHSVLEYVKAWLPDLPARIRLLTCAEMNGNPPSFQTHMSNWIGSMRSVRVWHCHDAYGLVVRLHDGFKLVYSGDTKPCDQLIRAGMDASLLIHEATFDDSMEEDADKKKHTTVGQAIDVARRMRAARLVLTHFSQRYPALPPPMSSTTSASSTLSAPEIFCAYDGFTIAL